MCGSEYGFRRIDVSRIYFFLKCSTPYTKKCAGSVKDDVI